MHTAWHIRTICGNIAACFSVHKSPKGTSKCLHSFAKLRSFLLGFVNCQSRLNTAGSLFSFVKKTCGKHAKRSNHRQMDQKKDGPIQYLRQSPCTKAYNHGTVGGNWHLPKNANTCRPKNEKSYGTEEHEPNIIVWTMEAGKPRRRRRFLQRNTSVLSQCLWRTALKALRHRFAKSGRVYIKKANEARVVSSSR